jgi:hypothetical protein
MVGDPDFSQDTYFECDPANLGWPEMTAHARSMIFGVDTAEVHVSACWSGYADANGYDREALDPITGEPNTYVECMMPTAGGEVDPRTQSGQLPCPPLPTTPGSTPTTSDGSDKASNLAHSSALTTNQVTVYACYRWLPPFYSEFLFGGPVTLRAVVTEAMQHQQ